MTVFEIDEEMESIAPGLKTSMLSVEAAQALLDLRNDSTALPQRPLRRVPLANPCGGAMTALPTRCPVRRCGTWTDATEHWPFCTTHYWQLPQWRRDDTERLIMACYDSGGDPLDEAALLRGVAESAVFLEEL